MPFHGEEPNGDDLAMAAHGVHHMASRGPEVHPANQAANILHALTFTSDQESIALLARLRLGESWSSVAENLPSFQSARGGTIRGLDVSGRRELLPALAPSTGPSNRHHYDGIVAGQSCADEVTSLLPEATSTPPKPWLQKLFDRQYFKQVSYIHCISRARSHTLPSEPASPESFGNMPFSSAIAANHHPVLVQEMQQHNYHVPRWAQRVLVTTTIQADPFHDIMTELQADILSGIPVEDLCGSHPYIAALDDAETFHRAPKLSQITARTIASLKPAEGNTTFTQYAMMYWFWSLWRWLLNPTKETYAEIPELLKPTTSQLFIAHPPLFDFLLTPALRDLLCQEDTRNIQWLTEAAITVECEWEGGRQAIFCRDGVTSEMDFNPICKVS